MTQQVDPQLLRTEIEQVRAELGQTVEALAAKFDVKSRAKEAMGHARADAKVRAQATRARVASSAREPLPLAAFAAAAAIVAVAIYLVRRRRP